MAESPTNIDFFFDPIMSMMTIKREKKKKLRQLGRKRERMLKNVSCEYPGYDCRPFVDAMKEKAHAGDVSWFIKHHKVVTNEMTIPRAWHPKLLGIVKEMTQNTFANEYCGSHNCDDHMEWWSSGGDGGLECWACAASRVHHRHPVYNSPSAKS